VKIQKKLKDSLFTVWTETDASDKGRRILIFLINVGAYFGEKIVLVVLKIMKLNFD
jgi:hypothetical protein